MLHLGCRTKPENQKNNERYKADKSNKDNFNYNYEDEKQNTNSNLSNLENFPTPVSSKTISSKILPNRSIKLKPLKNANHQLKKVSI